MNPITAIRTMLEAIGEGNRVKEFGYGYQEKADFTRAETESRIQQMQQRAAMAPHELTKAEMEAKKALFERAQRQQQAVRRGYAGDDDGAAQAAADMANKQQDVEMEALNAGVERDKTLTDAAKQKLPNAVAAISEGTSRKLRGMRAGDVGPAQPFTNDELDTVMNLRDDEQRASEAAAMRRSLETRATIGAGSRRGAVPTVGDFGLSPEAQNVVGSVMMRLGSKPKMQAAFAENVRRLAALGAEGEPELKRILRQGAVEGLDVGAKREIHGRQVMTSSLMRAKTILTDMARRGVPTGWMQGNAEDFLRRLGETGNPELVRLGTELDNTLIQYRHDMTGAAFGALEAQAYAKQLPNYRNSLPVNLGIIDGMLSAVQTHDQAFWEDTFGPDGAIFVGAVPERSIEENGQGGLQGGNPAPAAGAEGPCPGGQKRQWREVDGRRTGESRCVGR